MMNIENPMVLGNKQDSGRPDFEHYCSVCDGEIYFGMDYYELADFKICEDCRDSVLDALATLKTAGEE